jgi:hypothetical protein
MMVFFVSDWILCRRSLVIDSSKLHYTWLPLFRTTNREHQLGCQLEILLKHSVGHVVPMPWLTASCHHGLPSNRSIRPLLALSRDLDQITCNRRGTLLCITSGMLPTIYDLMSSCRGLDLSYPCSKLDFFRETCGPVVHRLGNSIIDR